MPAKSQRLALLVVLVMGLLMVSPLAANAATNRISGDAFYDAVQCPGPPPGYEDFTSYPGLVMTRAALKAACTRRSLQPSETPSGVYLESGEEVIVGSLERTRGNLRDDVQIRIEVGSGRDDRGRGSRTLPASHR